MQTEIDLNECEHFLKAILHRTKSDLNNECEHFLKAILHRTKTDPSWNDLSANGL